MLPIRPFAPKFKIWINRPFAASPTFTPNYAPMMTVNEQMYEEIADLLLKRIEETDFFNGTVEYDTDGFCSSLVCTLLVRRDGADGRIVSADPVWWEYRLHDGERERQTDFSWSELYRCLEKRF